MAALGQEAFERDCVNKAQVAVVYFVVEPVNAEVVLQRQVFLVQLELTGQLDFIQKENGQKFLHPIRQAVLRTYCVSGALGGFGAQHLVVAGQDHLQVVGVLESALSVSVKEANHVACADVADLLPVVAKWLELKSYLRKWRMSLVEM